MADDIRLVIGVDDRDLIKAQKQQLKFQRNLLSIETAYRKGDITAKRYNAELTKQTRELQKLGGSYNRASSEVRKFAYQLRTANDAALASSKRYAFAGKNVNRLGMQMQQAGYQIGDFAVQVQGGTNLMVALGQQGAQLLGIFGPAGAIAGAALAITTAFIAPLFAARKEVKGLTDDVKASLKEIREEVELSGLGATKAEAPFIDSITIATLELDKAQEKLNKRRANVLNQGETASRFWSREAKQVKESRDALNSINKDYQEFLTLRAKLSSQDPIEPFGGTGTDFVALKKEADEAEEDRINKLADLNARRWSAFVAQHAQSLSWITDKKKAEEDAAKAESKRVARRWSAFKAQHAQSLSWIADKKKAEEESEKNKAKRIANNWRAFTRQHKDSLTFTATYKKEQEELQAQIALGYKKSVGLSQTLTNETNAYVESVVAGFEAAADLKDELGEAAFEAGRIAGLDMTKPISDAAKEALTLAAKLGIAFETAQALMNLVKVKDYSKGVVLDPRAAGYDEGAARLARIQRRMQDGSEGYSDTYGTSEDLGGSENTSQEGLAELLFAKQQELDLETQLVGIFGAERQIQTELFNTKNQYSDIITGKQEDELEGILRLTQAERERQEVLEEAKAQQDSLAEGIASSFGDAFTSIIDGTKSAKEAFKDMAKSIIKQLLDVLVIQRLVGSVGTATSAGTGLAGLFSGTLASANGNVFSGGSQVQAYANGGVVSGPTNFPMSGNKMGLMGEAGPEAIMPLKRGSNGKLGVQMEGGGGGDVIHISQSFNFQANGDETVKKLIAQAAPKIAQMTKSSMLDDRRRGGVTKAAFG